MVAGMRWLSLSSTGSSTDRPVMSLGSLRRSLALAPVDVAMGRHGAVTSAEKQATAVGRAVLEHGGNAVDAAVALGLALGVTHPVAANMGGGGFMVVRKPDGTSMMIDFREMAP